MNILVINWQDWKNPLAGGAEIYLYEIFSRLARRGHKIMLLVSRAKGQNRHEFIDGLEIFRIGKRSNFNFLVPCSLRALLRNNEIDVIIDDLNKIPFYSRLFTREKVMPMLMHLFRSAIYRETIFPFASYVFLTESIIPFMYSSSRFISISDSTAEDLRSIGVRNKIWVVQSGIPEMPGLTAGNRRQKDLVAYVGRLKKYKSIDHFVRAVALVSKKRKIRAVIVGDGDTREGLMHLSENLGAEIEFTGYVSEEKKYEIYSNARVVVQPSIKEGWGLTAMEALACGTPVVCANSPGLSEVVVDGKVGFLYQYGDIESFAARIIDLLDDEKKWQAFSIAAKEWSGNFSWDNAADKLERILEEEVDRHK